MGEWGFAGPHFSTNALHFSPAGLYSAGLQRSSPLRYNARPKETA